jgi:hypothetical protein
MTAVITAARVMGPATAADMTAASTVLSKQSARCCKENKTG